MAWGLGRRVGAVIFGIALIVSPAAFAAKQKDPIKVTSAKLVQGAQKVAIGQFTVGFVIERKDSAKGGGGLMGSGFGGKSTVRSSLAGYSEAELQQIADAAYVDFVEKLTAAGFEVVDRAAVAGSPALAKLKGEAGPRELTTVTGRDDKAKVLFVSASQTAPLRFLPGDAMVSGFSAVGINSGAGQAFNAYSTYAKETGVNVINVAYYIDFANSEEYGGWFRSSSAVNVNGSLALLPGQSRISMVVPGYKAATLALNEPVAVGGDFFDKADAMSGGEKAMNAVGNVIGFLGGVGTNSSKKFTFTARPGTYVPGATQATAEANTMLVGRLAALR